MEHNGDMDRLLNDLARPTYSWRMSAHNNRAGSQAAYDRAVKEAEQLIRDWVKEHPES